MMAAIGGGKMNIYKEVMIDGQYVFDDNEKEKIARKQNEIVATIEKDNPLDKPILTDGTRVGAITDYLNKYCGFDSATFKYENRNYYYSSGGHISALDDVIYSLYHDGIPIVRVEDTRVLKYYNGYKCEHYIIVEMVDRQSETITIIDPHYDPKYFGRHTITFNEFYDIAKADLYGIWLSVYTDKGSQVS